MAKYCIDLLNASARQAPGVFTEQSNDNYLSAIEVAASILLEHKKKIIMLAGPSSSGKTTTANLFKTTFEKNGFNAIVASLDDFYLAHRNEYPLNPDGSYDCETVNALDIPLIHKCFNELLTEGKSDFPVFDFMTHERSDRINEISFSDNTILIVEGLHGLNPLITDSLPADSMAKVYVNLSSRVYDMDGSIIFGKTELRLIRRLIRDYQFRDMSGDGTLEVWPNVNRGEQEYIFPYRNCVDIKLDSFHPCEIGLFADKAIEILENVKDSSNVEKAGKMISKLKRFKTIDRNMLSGDSLLYEFIGQN